MLHRAAPHWDPWKTMWPCYSGATRNLHWRADGAALRGWAYPPAAVLKGGLAVALCVVKRHRAGDVLEERGGLLRRYAALAGVGP